MEIANCYNCHSENSRFYAEENGFSLVKCNECGLLYVQNLPDENRILQATKEGRHRGLKELHVSGRFTKSKIKQYLCILNDIYGHSINDINTWLDVGCGHGEFIIALRKYSSNKISIKGVEPNKEKQSSAQKRGLNVTFFDIETHDQKYECISLLDVYSHLSNPKRFILSLKKLLSPRGEILIQTGDSANLSPKEQFRPFGLPDHSSFASESILRNILSQLNFEILTINKYPYFNIEFKSILKEFLKIFLPKYTSNIKYLIRWKKYSETNMFIRARLKS